MTNSLSKPPRMLTLSELAALIKGYRKLKQWSQEDLAELSMLSVEQIEEVENGLSNAPDTLRSLGQAFGFADTDVFNKPIHIPTPQDFDVESSTPELDGIQLEAFVLSTGEELGELVMQSSALAVSRSFELGMQADKVFEALTDYVREYREYFEEYSTSRISDIHEEFQEYLGELKSFGVSISYATRQLPLDSAEEKSSPAGTALYLVAFPIGEEPDSFLV